MKKQNNLAAGISEPGIVDAYLEKLRHPLLDMIHYLRQLILSADKSVGEGIYWNAPTFYYMGKMKPFDPKEYKRYIVGFNFFKQDTICLIFLRGADAADPKKLLSGEFKDKRKLLALQSMEDIKKIEADLKKIIKDLVKKIDD